MNYYTQPICTPARTALMTSRCAVGAGPTPSLIEAPMLHEASTFVRWPCLNYCLKYCCLKVADPLGHVALGDRRSGVALGASHERVAVGRRDGRPQLCVL